MAKFGPPEQLRRFIRFQSALNLGNESGEVQVNSLLYSIEKEAEPIYESFVYAGDGEEENPELDGHRKV